MSDIDVSGVRTLSELLDQLPTGKAAAVLASRLGVWNEGLHKNLSEGRFTYPKNFSRMGDEEISAASSYWISEVARVGELVGMLEGQKIMTGLALKQVRASARARIRRAWDTPDADGQVRKYTNSQVDDEAESDEKVAETELKLALLEQVLSSAKAYKEACTAVTTGISREISFRQAQMGGGLR